jgi:organic hydroperoxide reductase OsmC/OhrA
MIFVAHANGVALEWISMSVTVQLSGEPILATSAVVVVTCKTLDGSSADDLIEQAKASCMAINSLRQGVPTEVRTAAQGQ